MESVSIQLVNNLKVRDLVDFHGQWNLDMLTTLLPVNVIPQIKALLPPNTSVWPSNSLGQFSASSSYHLFAGFNGFEEQDIWNKVWKLQVAQRVRSFVWLIVHDRLLANQRKHRMRLGDDCYNHCLNVPESTLHALQDCLLASYLWKSLVSWISITIFSVVICSVGSNLTYTLINGMWVE